MMVLFRSHGWFSAKIHTGHLQLVFASLSEKRWQKCLLFVILISQLSWFVVHRIVLSNMSAAT